MAPADPPKTHRRANPAPGTRSPLLWSNWLLGKSLYSASMTPGMQGSLPFCLASWMLQNWNNSSVLKMCASLYSWNDSRSWASRGGLSVLPNAAFWAAHMHNWKRQRPLLLTSVAIKQTKHQK